MRSAKLTIFLFLLFAFSLTAQHSVEAVKNPNLPYQFWVHYPDGYKNNPNKKYPLLMFLHGRSLQGTDLNRVKNYGVIYEILRGLKLEFIVVAPQCQSGWDNSKLIKILDYAENTYRVDKSKVYLTGMSMGGYGCWMFAGAYPKRFAAIAPVCGGGLVKDAKNLCSIPHWVHHGDRDNAVLISESEKMVNAVRAAGNKRVEFTIYKNQGHDLHGVYNNRMLYDWFLKHSIENAPKDENANTNKMSLEEQMIIDSIKDSLIQSKTVVEEKKKEDVNTEKKVLVPKLTDDFKNRNTQNNSNINPESPKKEGE